MWKGSSFKFDENRLKKINTRYRERKPRFTDSGSQVSAQQLLDLLRITDLDLHENNYLGMKTPNVTHIWYYIVSQKLPNFEQYSSKL